MKKPIQELVNFVCVQFFFVFYDIIFLIGLLFIIPFYFLRKKINFTALKEKLGFINVKRNSYIWIHAVSVGEVLLVYPLLKRLYEICKYPIIVSTTTLAGNRLAKAKYSLFSEVIFLPYDISFILKSILQKIKPKIFIAVETEIWPNLFYNLKRKKVPILIINARLSNKAFRRYRLLKPIFSKILKNCDLISAQNQLYKDRFIDLGYPSYKIVVTGNLKFESIYVDTGQFKKIKETYEPKIKANNTLIIAASTHHPEEKIFIKVFSELKQKFKNIALIIAPRHIERVESIEKLIKDFGYLPIRISKLEKENSSENAIYILDTIGQLIYFYGLSDICFVGGSLVKFGGHNILEPLYFAKPTIFGPFMDNFKEIEEIVLHSNAAIKIKNINELKEVLQKLLVDKNFYQNLALNSLKVFKMHKDVVEKNISFILKFLKHL